jgi:hypothetical protein
VKTAVGYSYIILYTVVLVKSAVIVGVAARIPKLAFFASAGGHREKALGK